MTKTLNVGLDWSPRNLLSPCRQPKAPATGRQLDNPTPPSRRMKGETMTKEERDAALAEATSSALDLQDDVMAMLLLNINIKLIEADYQLTRIADAMEEWMKPEIKLAETLGGNTKPADAIGKE